METLAFETIVLLLAAFVAGCFVGHVLRGLLAGPMTLEFQKNARETADFSAPGRSEPQRPQAQKKTVRDDLTQIVGIDPAVEKKLNRLGVKRFEQIAGWDVADVAVIDQRLAFKGRIEREQWISQARLLAAGV